MDGRGLMLVYSVMMAVYSLLLALVLVVGAPYWLVRMATSGRYRAGLAGRLGRVPEELRTACAGKDVIWIHAVSVGEAIAAARLVEELRTALPGWVIAVSTTTDTGQRLARQRLANSPVFYLPLDFRWTVRRYLRTVNPRLLVLMESELWPRLLVECRRQGVPVAVVNARVSDRSFPRYMRLRRLWRALFGMVAAFLAQSEETAGRLKAIGAPANRVRVTGNLKYDARAAGGNVMAERIGSLLGGMRLVVAGSTLPGEEEMLIEAWNTVQWVAPDAALLIAPRHKERFDEVEALIGKNGYAALRCSGLAESAEPLEAKNILLLDTIGDLASVYSLAGVAFVGGSLVPKGGHNPLEAAQFGVPVVMGPSYENFRDIVGAMASEDAIRIVGLNGLQQLEHNLERALEELLTNTEEARALGERGRRVFAAQSGATARSVEALLTLLQERSR